MRLIIAKTCGFCGGVNNTIKKTLEVLKNGQKVYSLGEIVHNDYVIKSLEDKGLMVTSDINIIPRKSKVIIRAHGEPKDTIKKLQNKEIEIIDLTCPKVKVIHNKIINEENSFVVIIGKKHHPEVIGHLSYTKNSFVISKVSEIDDMQASFLESKLNRMYIVSQTTFNEELFQKIVNEIKDKCQNIEIIVDNTICKATEIRQRECEGISQMADKMIIIGGKNSSNTKELANIALKHCNDVYLIENSMDLENVIFQKDDVVGITAGASTPDELIKEVINYLENLSF